MNAMKKRKPRSQSSTQGVIVALHYPVSPEESVLLRVGGPPCRSPFFLCPDAIICNHGALSPGMHPTLHVTVYAAFLLCGLSHP